MTKKVQTPKVIRELLMQRLRKFKGDNSEYMPLDFNDGLCFGLCRLLYAFKTQYLNLTKPYNDDLSEAIAELQHNIDYVLNYSAIAAADSYDIYYGFDYIPDALLLTHDITDGDTQRYIRLKWLQLWEEQGIAATYDYFENTNEDWKS